MDLVVIALSFVAIFIVELPDKTFSVTLVLSTKFRPLFVWIGVGLAFLAQTLVTVGLGKAATFLPDTVVLVEWGDWSQLLTLSLVAKYDDPVSVFIGAWGALLAVSGLAVIVGRVLLKRIKLSRLHYLGASVCLLMACLTVWEMTR